jgi:hypothetical protein
MAVNWAPAMSGTTPVRLCQTEENAVNVSRPIGTYLFGDIEVFSSMVASLERQNRRRSGPPGAARTPTFEGAAPPTIHPHEPQG